jgi:PKD repeat protein
MKSLSKLMISIFAAVTMSLAISCGEDEPSVEKPIAIFDFVVNANRSGQVSFTSESLRADSYAWNFGDDEGTSTEANPSYTYTEEGTYTVTLTVKNDGGEHSASLDIVVFVGAPELIKDGDMSKVTSWSTRQIWTDADNAVNHTIKDGVFFMDNAPGTRWSQYVLWQEISLTAGKQYVFSADLAASAGVNVTGSIWLEVYLSKVDPATSGSDYPNTEGKTMRLNFRQECGKDVAFNGKLQELAQSCQEANGLFNMGTDGKFTLSASELNTGGKIYVVFKVGTWDDDVNFKDGMTLDNVSIKEVL